MDALDGALAVRGGCYWRISTARLNFRDAFVAVVCRFCAREAHTLWRAVRCITYPTRGQKTLVRFQCVVTHVSAPNPTPRRAPYTGGHVCFVPRPPLVARLRCAFAPACGASAARHAHRQRTARPAGQSACAGTLLPPPRVDRSAYGQRTFLVRRSSKSKGGRSSPEDARSKKAVPPSLAARHAHVRAHYDTRPADLHA